MLKEYLASMTTTDHSTPLKGTAQSNFALFSLPKAFILAHLPEALELAPHPLGDLGDKHPAGIFYNDTDLVFNLFLQQQAKVLNLEPKLRYDELLVFFPYVQFKEKPKRGIQGPYIYLPILYLNSIIAVIGGRVFYEFNKVLAHFKKEDNTAEVQTLWCRQPIVKATFINTGQSGPATSFPNFSKLIPLLQLPVIEHGPYGYVSSIYTLDYQNTRVQPNTLMLENVGSHYLPVGNVQVPDITQSALGAFAFTYTWSLSYPEFIEW